MKLLHERNFSPSSFENLQSVAIAVFKKYVASINEPEELVEGIRRCSFGQILHKIVDSISEPHLNVF
ncbi:MAG: hypothetical protein IPF58_17425 [Saprospirales bacterium]|nr:hypothetical protein [Saprospirales bacterium]